jgi:hypothetical protein
MSRSKSRQVGTAGLVLRYRDGTCSRACRRCGQWASARSWRAGLREARAHAADHDAEEARYVGTPWGIPAHELPRRRARRSSRFAALLLVALLLLVSSAGTYLAVEAFTTRATTIERVR